MSKETKKYLVIIIALALGLRLVGIMHGFPFIFHPDEPTIVRSALGIRFNLNPGHFDWPHLYIYLNYFLYMGFAKLRDLITAFGYQETVYFLAPIIWNDELIFYLLTRGFTAILGALTIIPLYLTGKILFGEKPGLWAAAALAVTPFHVWHSHYSLADVPMLFFLSWSLYFTVKILFRREISNYLLAGLFAGLAASTKYNGAIIVTAILLAHLVRVWTEKSERVISFESIEVMLYAAFTSLLGFIVGTPFAVLDYRTFLRTDGPKGALWQFTNVGSLPLPEHLRAFFLVFYQKLAENFGYALLTLFVLAFFYLIYKTIKEKSILLQKDLFFLVLLGFAYIYYLSGFESDRAHYYFIVYPFVILAGAGLLSKTTGRLQPKLKNLLWLALLSLPLFCSVLGTFTFYNKDTRLLLYYWLQDRSRQVSKVYYTEDELKPVFEKLDLDSDRVASDHQEFSYNSLMISDEKNRPELQLTGEISNNLRKGPHLYLYQP